MNYYSEPFKKYAVFSGRATRKEYWLFALFQILIIAGLIIIDSLVFSPRVILTYIYVAAIFVPSWALVVRRLHDSGRSAWSLLWVLFPFVGSVVLTVLYCIKSQPGENKYGPNPSEQNPIGTIPVDVQPTI